MSHELFMKRALELASKARGRTSPNPLVGAVIVKKGRIIAEGYHRKAGTAHAEIVALKKAGDNARGATLYLSLEPCCHTDKRTPPCTGSIIHSGIKKVVVAMIDPNPRVSGMGLKELRKAGIKTEKGLLENEARKLNEPFIKYIRTNIPFVVLKIAQSLDGKIATSKGESKWITGEVSRRRVHKLRNDLDAVLVGSGTVLKDNPSLDCRIRGGINPYRVIVDSTLRIPMKAKVLQYDDGKTIIATTSKAPKKRIDLIHKLGHRVFIIRNNRGMADLKSLMIELGKVGITSVMIEGGASLSASALQGNVIDKIMLFCAPKIIGGTDSIPSVGGNSPAFLKNALRVKDLQVTKSGEDLLLEGYIT
jgi:diaminohydroxyphosphoribosylaminopyrimidine deaminase/5-amino-6-(5-phosphoribosylamino)uracil reductase